MSIPLLRSQLSLEEFLKLPDASLFREAMFRHQLLHEIYLTCAYKKRNVHVYEPEIDVSGFDMVIDDLQSTLRFQIKSKMSTSKASSWNIHKGLLRPNIESLNSLPFNPDSGGVGYMGGVILITATIKEDQVSYSYSYTDALVICAMNLNIGVPSQNAALHRSIAATFKELTRVDYRPALIKIPENVFWKFASLQKLLEFAGFDVSSMNPYRYNLHRALSQIYRMECKDPLRKTPEDAQEFAKAMISEMLALG